MADVHSFEYAYKENEKYRLERIIVSDLEFDSLEDAISYAKENGFDAVIEYKENEKKLWEVNLC